MVNQLNRYFYFLESLIIDVGFLMTLEIERLLPHPYNHSIGNHKDD